MNGSKIKTHNRFHRNRKNIMENFIHFYNYQIIDYKRIKIKKWKTFLLLINNRFIICITQMFSIKLHYQIFISLTELHFNTKNELKTF